MSQFEPLGRRANAAVVRQLAAVIAQRQVKVAALSRAAGIPRSSLHNKLSGKAELTVAELVQLAVALDIPAGDLFATAADAVAGEDQDGGEEPA